MEQVDAESRETTAISEPVSSSRATPPILNDGATRKPSIATSPQSGPDSQLAAAALESTTPSAASFWDEELAERWPPFVSWQGLKTRLEAIWGTLCLLVGLAILAVLPLIQLISLGYLYAAMGRVARSGRLRAGFVALNPAARLGSAVLASWLTLLPLRFAASLHASSLLIDPSSATTRNLRVFVIVLAVLTTLHLALALMRGARLRDFIWPFGAIRALKDRLRAGQFYARLSDDLWQALEPFHFAAAFSLGFRGLLGSFLWLALPTTLLALGTRAPGLGWLGALALVWVVMVLPLLQAHFAREERFSALFEVSIVRESFRHAPLACLLAIALTLLLPIPLYLLKVELVAHEAGWLPSIFFVLFLWPARLAAGWALSRAKRRPQRSHWFWRLLAKPALLPIAGFYVLMVFFSQFISWEGVASLFGQHAFLVPVPFARFGDF